MNCQKRIILTASVTILFVTLALPVFLTAQEEDREGNARGLFYAPYHAEGDYAGPVENYTIQAGDTLRGIAQRKLGDPTKAGLLARMNRINDPHRIYAGQRISVPIPRIGLRHAVELLVGSGDDCDLVRVAPGHRFHSGDRFRLRLAANHNGYLYIFNKDESDTVRRLFPNPRINRGRNYVRSYTAYQVPPTSWLRFDENPGEEQVLVILALAPVDELEELEVADDGVLPAREWERVEDLFRRLRGTEAGGNGAEEGDGEESFLIQTRTEGTNALAVRFTLRHEREW